MCTPYVQVDLGRHAGDYQLIRRHAQTVQVDLGRHAGDYQLIHLLGDSQTPLLPCRAVNSRTALFQGCLAGLHHYRGVLQDCVISGGVGNNHMH